MVFLFLLLLFILCDVVVLLVLLLVMLDAGADAGIHNLFIFVSRFSYFWCHSLHSLNFSFYKHVYNFCYCEPHMYPRQFVVMSIFCFAFRNESNGPGHASDNVCASSIKYNLNWPPSESHTLSLSIFLVHSFPRNISLCRTFRRSISFTSNVHG